MSSYHIPVLLNECLHGLKLIPDGIYVDATFGGGGHSREILNQLNENGKLAAMDQDKEAERNLISDSRFLFLPYNFRFIQKILRLNGIEKVHGILADLGVSSHQIDSVSRGFSYKNDSPLDMRMNAAQTITASQLISTKSESELQEIFSRYGEVRNARSLARHISEKRNLKLQFTSAEFIRMIEPLIRGNRTKYIAQVFQALRIAVNDELNALREFLEQTLKLLLPGGRLVIISYHSLEDVLVKNFMRYGPVTGQGEKDFFGNRTLCFRRITLKPITPAPEEIHLNPRARSARLRIAERI
jgi:16S rRNA (cytosine1402-N4)-methyltransferase